MQSKYNEITKTTTPLSCPQHIYQTTSKQRRHLKRYPLPKKKIKKKICPQKIPYQHTPLIPRKKKKENETAEHKRLEEKDKRNIPSFISYHPVPLSFADHGGGSGGSGGNDRSPILLPRKSLIKKCQYLRHIKLDILQIQLIVVVLLHFQQII